MAPNTDRTVTRFGHRRTAGILVACLAVSSLGLTGCGVIKAVKHVVDKVETDKHVVDDFTTKINTGNAPYYATYATTGSSPATIHIGATPPDSFAFTSSASSGNANTDIVQNSSGTYACSQQSSSGSASKTWSCTKLPVSEATTYKDIYQLYTGAYWSKWLGDLALGAAFAGSSVSSTTKSIPGFPNMQCIVVSAVKGSGSNASNTGTFCVTSQGYLGLVQLPSTAVFEIKHFDSSPPASLFQLPPGAKVTTIPTTTTTTTG
jgi:hypothetical protein